MDHLLIGTSLVSQGFLLSALEFHFELLERGHSLSFLKDFFENSENFDESTKKDVSPPRSLLTRASSQVTLDSLSLYDGARFSEDSRQSESDRLAVLEFELRKAQETIASLQEELHFQETAYGLIPPQQNISKRELRTLNYLINQFLLKHNYKLTSITLCDENDDMDFEDWSSLGFTGLQPPDLLHIFRNYTSLNKVHISIQTETIEYFDASVNTSHEEKKKKTEEEKEKEEEKEILKHPLSSSLDNFEMPSVYKDIFYKSFDLLDSVEKSDYKSENLHDVLIRTLFEIIPNSKNKESFFNILLVSIEHCSNEKIRTSLLTLYFNLIPNPESLSQRRKIIKGLLSLMSSVCESEILSFILEEITHKYSSRRSLATEICSAILPFISESLRNSYILSLLQQLLLEDKETKFVKDAAIHCSARLLCLMTDDDKVDLLWNLFKSLLIKDTSFLLSQDVGLQILCLFSYRYSKRENNIFFKDVLSFLKERVEPEFENEFIQIFSILNRLLVFAIVAKVESHLSASEIHIFVNEQKPFVINSSNVHKLINLDILDDILEISSCISIKQIKSVNSLIYFVTQLHHYGSFHSKMDEYLSSCSSMNRLIYNSSLLPVVLLSHQICLQDIKRWTLFYCSHKLSIEPLEYIVNYIAINNRELHSEMADYLSELGQKQESDLRTASGIYLIKLGKHAVDSELVNKSILPAMLSLTSDSQINIRILGSEGLSSLLSNPITDTAMAHEISHQFISIFEDPQNVIHPSFYLKLIHYLGHFCRFAPEKTREQNLFPKLASTITKHEDNSIILNSIVDAFSYMLQSEEEILQFSTKFLRCQVLPSLKILETHKVHRKSIHDLVLKVENVAPSSVNGKSSQTIEEMKEKFGKFLFNKQPFSKS